MKFAKIWAYKEIESWIFEENPLIGYLEFWGQISNFEFNLFRVKRLFRRSEMFESPLLRLPKMEWIRFVTINTNINIITTSYQVKCISFDWCWKLVVPKNIIRSYIGTIYVFSEITKLNTSNRIKSYNLILLFLTMLKTWNIG